MRIFLYLAISFVLLDQFIISTILPNITLFDVGILFYVLYILTIRRPITNKRIFIPIKIAGTLYFLSLFVYNTYLFIINKIEIMSFFYIIKEMEYFLLFFLLVNSYYYIKKYSLNLLFVLVVINVLYAYIEMVKGGISFYGIGALVTGSPEPSASIYLMIVFVLAFLELNKIKPVFFFIIICSFPVIATVSRINIVSLIFIIFIIVITKLYNNGFSIKKKNAIINLSMFVLIIILFLSFTQTQYAEVLSERIYKLDNAVENRSDKWANEYELYSFDNIEDYLFGKGKGIPEQIKQDSTLGVDSQYLRSFIEMGVMGSFLHLLLLITTISVLWKNSKYKAFILTIVIVFSLKSITIEALQVTRPAISFWGLAGLQMGYIINKRYNK
ncbi:hypothetical protein J2S78_000288 [Salibacterium salarium]|uniref:hypothetical protein n=1 Tax=Salibacterium salarium TaxID=284579 RepID=UPI002782A8D2|nr:hypothetical protein [Salibacterium salarium]MDQ0297880.1 hypothetical protein [Salibacterium salarium]